VNWYKTAINTGKINWDEIHSNYDFHINEILEGRKPAGLFDIKFDNEINYYAYPKILETIKDINKIDQI